MRCSPPTPAAGTLLFRRRTRRPPSVRAGAVGRGGVQRCGDAGVESSPPFGGVGASGMGRYHGEASFECFSNCRSYFLGSKRFDLPLRYAPYPKRLLGWLRRLMD